MQFPHQFRRTWQHKSDRLKDYNEETKQTTYRIEENIRPEDILNYESRIFMYSSPSRNNINDIFYKCIELYGIPSTKSIVSDKTNITRFEYILNNQLYIFVVDPNDAIHVNYKMVIHFCLKNKVEFKNQTFPSFIRELKDIHIKNKSKREEKGPVPRRFQEIKASEP